jgi:hypothetical protein
MAKLYDLARITTATTGTGTITLGAAVSGCLSFAGAGASNGDIIDYAISDGANSEIGTGTYTSSGTTLTRTVTKSTNANTAISLSGTAQVFISPRAETLSNASSLTSGTVPLAQRGYTFPDVIIEEQFTSGTNAGTFTAGSFVTRALNTFVRNVGTVASVSGGQVTLPAGTWAFKWSAPAFDVGNHQTILFNVTSSITQGVGTSEDASGTTNTTSSVGSSVAAVAGSTVFALQHQCGTTRATNGFGVGAGFTTEVFSRLEITQLA